MLVSRTVTRNVAVTMKSTTLQFPMSKHSGSQNLLCLRKHLANGTICSAPIESMASLVIILLIEFLSKEMRKH